MQRVVATRPPPIDRIAAVYAWHAHSSVFVSSNAWLGASIWVLAAISQVSTGFLDEFFPGVIRLPHAPDVGVCLMG